MVDQGWYRTEGGTIMLMDHPLGEGIAQRVARGEITRVANSQGDPWVEEPAQPAPATPAELALAEALERVADLERQLAAAAKAKAPRQPKAKAPELSETQLEG